MALFVLTVELEYFNTIVHYVNMAMRQICFCYIFINDTVIAQLSLRRILCKLISPSLRRLFLVFAGHYL